MDLMLLLARRSGRRGAQGRKRRKGRRGLIAWRRWTITRRTGSTTMLDLEKNESLSDPRRLLKGFFLSYRSTTRWLELVGLLLDRSGY